MKASPLRLVRAHYATLVDAQTGKIRLLDHLLFEGLPVVVTVISGLAGVTLSGGVTVGLLTVAGLLSAFFFGAMLQVSMSAMTWADQRPVPGPDVSRHAEFLKQIAANSGYASLVCILTATLFVISSFARGTAQVVFSSLGVGLGIHLVLMLFMVSSRIFALMQQRLTDARTGHAIGVTSLPDQTVHQEGVQRAGRASS